MCVMKQEGFTADGMKRGMLAVQLQVQPVTNIVRSLQLTVEGCHLQYLERNS